MDALVPLAALIDDCRARIAGDPDTLLVAIIGGTGAYNGAKGTITSVTQ
jgi:hypothetical protein